VHTKKIYHVLLKKSGKQKKNVEKGKKKTEKPKN